MIPEYQVTLIAKENIPLVLPHVRARIEKVLAETGRGEYTMDDLEERLATGASQLWLGATKDNAPTLRMLGITQIVTHDRVRRLRVEMVEGEDLEGFCHHLEVLEYWAVQLGATETEAYVRPGVGKKLKAFGFKKACEVVIRPILRSHN